jgi:hypothetical protein
MFPAGASAGPAGVESLFEQCPLDNPAVSRCLYASIDGGEVILGKTKAQITEPGTLQGAYGKAGPDEFASGFFAANDGATLDVSPQPVSGGLAGVAPPADATSLAKVVTALLFENPLTGLDATVELAKPAGAIRSSENHLAEQFDTALKLPVRIHLENPILGSKCYIGSSSSPILWKLTTTATSPPPPNKPIEGKPGKLELLGEGAVATLSGAILVDNAWSAPTAHGCGGPFSSLVDPLVNEAAGLPSASGHNTVILTGTVYEAPRVVAESSEKEE